MSRHPIPDAALDDRLGIVGTAGSGKTYTAMLLEERVLDRKGRVIHVDPLGVAWGLRLMADGKTQSPYDIVIFGGPHGDLPLTEHAGALIGETVARMAESCILDLSRLGTKAAERRFMLAFTTALYKNASGEPVHLIFDEVDMFAPQKLLDKDGDAARLLGMMETIVRRGRRLGFIPWLISQRPAVINKDILSQVDGLIAMKLTASQDRKALGAWIEGQADVDEGKKILADLPTKQKGEGVVWIPARSILNTVQFPEKTTFDSSRAPRRGEKARKIARLKELDIKGLKEKLATVEAETKANDPKALKAELAKLKGELAAARKGTAVEKPAVEKIVADPKAIELAHESGMAAGRHAGMMEVIEIFEQPVKTLGHMLDAAHIRARDRAKEAKVTTAAQDKRIAKLPRASVPIVSAASTPHRVVAAPRREVVAVADGVELRGPERRILGSLVVWQSLGHDAPTRSQVAFVAGYSPDGSAFTNPLGALKSAERITYPGTGRVQLLNSEGAADLGSVGVDALLARLKGPERRILDAVRQGRATRAEIAQRASYSPDGSAFTNPLGRLRTLELIDYPATGEVELTGWAAELLGTLPANA